MTQPELRTLHDVQQYIQAHEVVFSYPPYAIGLLYENYINILAECAADGRCTNITAHVKNVKLVRL
jgi:hypothetical protein